MLPQTRSPLFRLPGELRNEIFDLALTPSTPIVDPKWDTTIKPEHGQITTLGIALLRTCRAIYLEANNSVPLQNGDFVFTRVAHIQAFFCRLSLAQASHIRHITIDLKDAASGDRALQSEQSATIANEWVHYFCCTRGAHMLGAWCADLSTLTSDVPYLRSLCFDLTNWQPSHAGSRIGGWRYLQTLLRRTRDLDSITLKSKCLDSSSWTSQPVPWSLGLWFSPAFDKDESALVDLMGQTVRAAGEKEVISIKWHTADGITSLTVTIGKAEDVSPLSSIQVPLSQNGNMSWDSFLEFKDNQVELTRRKASLSVSSTIWDNAPAIQV
ncbi:uncharacterized protein M437DRAFT_78384 [Aureobasidium melanogenum CBS 110374]|uniref:Uncharacterized protein n=1 Tax=Aureobasidium melanogenum (strain CBS 110374) TaxID=1043003 RepID=A0A074VEU3_AURM1|nr:uncharacterized protein M437DRAFT_78384 [Aureobasidium melanogenum CBS 110374]KEQ59255.1 hypothetical protein M437DRAFT_78384 [Aureobasidium melanogenum CBS 110374]